ncbi:helix-turn-helix domain-containing protein, partial [Frankia sp. AvcI1]
MTTRIGEAPASGSLEVASEVGDGGAERTRAERRRARIRATIADAALRMFMSRGYDATTVEDVAAAVDLSPRTVFRYFPFKEDMLREAV